MTALKDHEHIAASLNCDESIQFRILRRLYDSKPYYIIPGIEIILSTKRSLQQPLVCFQVMDSDREGYCDSEEEYQHGQSSLAWYNSSN